MKVKYIKYNKIRPEMFADDHEIDYDMSTFFCGFPETTFLMLTGDYNPEKYLYTDKIKNIEMVRVLVSKGVEAGIICYFENTAKIDLHIPIGILPVRIVEKALLANVIKTLKLQKFNPIYRNNDLLIKVNNKLRKFCGIFHCELKGWDYYAIPVSFKINYNLIKDIYRLDTQKMAKKGEIEKISDVIMGLDEIGIVGKESFLDLFVENFSKRFDWEIIKDDFSEKEKKQLYDL